MTMETPIFLDRISRFTGHGVDVFDAAQDGLPKISHRFWRRTWAQDGVNYIISMWKP